MSLFVYLLFLTVIYFSESRFLFQTTYRSHPSPIQKSPNVSYDSQANIET